MADQSVPRRNQAYVLRTTLVSQANVNVMQDPPTVAAGDVKRSIDGAAIANTTNAPALVPGGGKIAAVTLTAAEMNCDILVVAWADAVGAEWQDQTWLLHPTNSTLAVLAATLVTILANTVTILANTVTIIADIAAIAATLVTVLVDIAAVNVIVTATQITVNATNVIVTATQIVVNAIQVTVNAILVCCNSVVGNVLNALLGVSAIAKALRSHDLTLYRGDTWSQQISGLGDLTGFTDIWVGCKADPADADSASIFLISQTVGLEVINGTPATVPGNAIITVVNLTAGIIQVDFEEVETAKLVPDKRFWDAQTLIVGTVTTPKAGRITITADIVRTVT